MDDGTWGLSDDTSEVIHWSPAWGHSCYTESTSQKPFLFLWSFCLGSKMGLVDFCLMMWYFSEAQPVFFFFLLLLSLSSFLSLRSVSDRYAFATSCQDFPSHREDKAYAVVSLTPGCSCSILFNKSNTSQGNLIGTLCDLWTERVGQESGSEPTRLLMGS